MDRRQFLRATGVAALGGAAGCSGGNATGDPAASATEEAATTGGRAGTTSGATETATARSLRTQYRSRERYRQPGEQFLSLDSTAGWRSVSGTATESERSFSGSGSVKLVGEGGDNAAIEYAMAPTDLSEKDLSVAVRTTTPLEIAVMIRLLDAEGNWAALELRQLSYQPPDVGWFRTCPGVFDTSETEPDWEHIERLQLVALNASDGDVTMWADDVRAHPKPEKGYVVLCWDDGRADYFRTAARKQRSYDLPGVITMPPTVEKVGEGPFMSLSQFRQRSEAGDEVVAHGTVGATFNTVSAERLDALLRRKKRWLTANDFDGRNFVVYPANNYDATSLAVTGKYFLMGGMNQSGNVNTTGVNGFDPLVLPRTIGHDLDIAKAVVDKAAAYRNCGILNFHHFDTDNTVDPDEYEELLAHVDRTDGVEAITFSELWAMRTD